HQTHFLERMDVLEVADDGATFLLNTPYGPDEVWERLPVEVQEQIIVKGLRFFVVDGHRVAREAGLAGRINTVLQTCFFALSGILPREDAMAAIKKGIEKAYGKRGREVLERNFAAVDAALEALHQVAVPDAIEGERHRLPPVPDEAPDFVRRVTGAIIARQGDLLPVSAFPVDGTFPSGTARWEKRSIALELPAWDPEICIDCAKCVLVCPHAAIRMKVWDPEVVDAPAAVQHKAWRGKDFAGHRLTIQVAPDDCTGCAVCADICPAVSKEDPSHKSLTMVPTADRLEADRAGWKAFQQLPTVDRTEVRPDTVKGSGLLEPLFEFSGACAGCGETPYLGLLSRLFGDRTLVANATGCSSIFGGNLPTTPWSKNDEGRGPAWSNSLFEDNAEFGLGMRAGLDRRAERARRLLAGLSWELGWELPQAILRADQDSEEEIARQRARVAELKERLEGMEPPEARELLGLADDLVRKNVWIVGGDGWAYDIGFGGLDHVLASGRDVNILVLDTEVYSNTGGQASKATPLGAAAKFASAGKATAKKDLGMIAMTYGDVYVAQVALGADNPQTVKALAEAEAYPGPSLVIAYGTCIEHGIEMATSMTHQKEAVAAGHWPLYRYDPRRVREGSPAFQLDSRWKEGAFREFAMKETRFAALARSNPVRAEQLLEAAEEDIAERWRRYERLAAG
ncbi:MAG TPA: 2-oxoacid:acceptor oxidoreductase family protein, partial [Actinomycetota bacterium]